MFNFLLFILLFNLYYFKKINLPLRNISEYYSPENIMELKKKSDTEFFLLTETKFFVSLILKGYSFEIQDIITNNYTDIYYVSSLDLYIYACTPLFFIVLVKNGNITSSVYKDYNLTSRCRITYIESEDNIYVFFAYQNPSNSSVSNIGYLNAYITFDYENYGYILNVNENNSVLPYRFINKSDNLYKTPIVISTKNSDSSCLCVNFLYNNSTDNSQHSVSFLISLKQENQMAIYGDFQNEYMTQLIPNNTGFFLAGVNIKSNYIKYISIIDNTDKFTLSHGNISLDLSNFNIDDIRYNLYLSHINSTNIGLFFLMNDSLYFYTIGSDGYSLIQMNLLKQMKGFFIIQYISNIFVFIFFCEDYSKYYLLIQPISCIDDSLYIHENETISKNVLDLTDNEFFSSNIRISTTDIYFNLTSDEKNNSIITYTDSNQSDYLTSFFLFTTKYNESYNHYYKKCNYNIHICNSACKTCSSYSDSINSPNCLTCEENYYLTIDATDNSNCYHYEQQVEFYYFNSTLKLFDKCNKACLYCSNNSNDENNTLCIDEKCNENYAYLSDNSKQCYLNNLTLKHYYINSDKKIFNLCNSACLYCNEGSNDINDTKCVAKQCNDRYTYLIDNENNCILTTREIENYYVMRHV